MKNINKLTLISMIATSTLVAADISIEAIGLNLGSSNSSYSQTNNQGSISLGNTPDKSFNSYELFTTIKNLEIYNMKPYISYTYSSNDELKHQYLLAGLNKYYNHDKINLYAGALVGYGQLDWKYDPINNAKDKNVDANSFIAGIQLGFEYPLNTKLSLGFNSKYLIHNYETNLNPTNTISSTIEHKDTLSLSFGVNYSF